MTQSTRTIDVLGTPLLVTNYEDVISRAHDLARRGGTWAIDLTNTHIVTMRKEDAHFREITTEFDFFVPDGMPLIWCMNARGAGLSDRVYGPTFMRTCLEASPAPWRHFLLGGSEECGEKLRANFPSAQFVGSFHGYCNDAGVLEGSADEEVVRQINLASPDFIWVGLGAPKQYEWIARHRARISRGVISAVGFAFDVNAGLKKDAPLWMQRVGLTWIFRAFSEPQRLLARYLRYNTRFVYYLTKSVLFKNNA